jgi:chromate reductase
MKVLALCGSLRAASMNAALLRAASRLAPAGMTVTLFSGMARLPLFNPDLEADLPAPVRELHVAIADCDALIIASPEYAHGVTAVIKNALDWLVSHEGFVDKPVAVFNASPRSVHADASLRETLITMSADLRIDACVSLPLRSTGMDEHAIVESEYAPALRRALAILARVRPS